MLDPGVRNLDKDDIIGVLAAILMIDNDNKPAPENLPSPEDSMVLSNDAMGLWSHSGICQQKSMAQCNANPELTFWTLSLSDPSKLNLFKGLFFVINQNNNPSPDEQKPSPWGETHSVWGISTLDWSVDAYGDCHQPTEARVLGHTPNRHI